MTMHSLKSRLIALEEEMAVWSEEISSWLFAHPELSDEEYESAAYLTGRMQEQGFSVSLPFAEIPTAFACEYTNGDGPKVAFLAEYDALSGYGPDGTGIGHACGHNWIGASCAGAALAVKRLMEQENLKGSVWLIGTPSEEKRGAKVNMAEQGVFDSFDGVFQCHLDKQNSTRTTMLAMTDFIFSFQGKASHAAGLPEAGINALDACHLTLAGINALRQQLPPETKIHCTYDNGGGNPAIIPAFASLKVYVRDAYKDRLETIIERLLDIGRGAELMTHAKFSYTRAENTYYDLKPWRELQDYMENNLRSLGMTAFADGDIYHSCSSDIGNVSYACPTAYTTIGVSEYTDAGLHEEAFLSFADSEKAHELLHLAAKGMGMSAIDVLTNANDVSNIKK